MPRKKSSNAVNAQAAAASVGGSPSVSGQPVVAPEEEIIVDGISNYELPKSIVTRISKASVSGGSVNLQKEVPLALVKGSTVFINYLTTLAHDAAGERGHKTIAAVHVLDAVKQLGWEDTSELVKLLNSELKVFRAAAEAKKSKLKVPGGVFPGRPSVLNPVPGVVAPTSKGKASKSAKPKAKAKKGAVASDDDDENDDEPEEDEDDEDDMRNPHVRKVVDDRAGDGDDDFYKDGDEEVEDYVEEEDAEEDDVVDEEEEEENLPELQDEEMKGGGDGE